MSSLVVFDLDGTLVDTPCKIVEAMTAVLGSLGAVVPDAAAIRATIGLPLAQTFGRPLGVPQEDDRVARGVEQYRARFNQLVMPQAEKLIFPGVTEGLATLRKQGSPSPWRRTRSTRAPMRCCEGQASWATSIWWPGQIRYGSRSRIPRWGCSS